MVHIPLDRMRLFRDGWRLPHQRFPLSVPSTSRRLHRRPWRSPRPLPPAWACGRRCYAGDPAREPSVNDRLKSQRDAHSEQILDVPRLRRMWTVLRELPRSAASEVMTNGDLIPGNMLVRDGRPDGPTHPATHPGRPRVRSVAAASRRMGRLQLKVAMAGLASYALGMPICAHCGEDNPARARFCLACGSPLAVAGTGREVRKTVTVVFSDLVGSTPLGERLDPESLREVITRYYDRAAQVLARHGGTVAKFIGDAVMAVFGIPWLHEDDALRAVRAAAELGGALEELNAELEAAWGVRLALRTGVNTGEVVAGDAVQGQDLVVGDAVNVAARLEQAAGPGQVLLGGRTWQLVRDAVEVEPMAPLGLKGKAEPVACFRLLGVRPATTGHARHLDAPMVGRRRELGLLGSALDRAVGGRRCQLAVVLGPAGVGKSRLVQAFLETVQGQATVLRGRCLEYGEGLTYWPIAEAIRAAASVAGPEGAGGGRAGLRGLLEGEEHAAFVAEGLAGLADAAGRTASREEIPWAVTRLFEVLAH